MRGEFLINELLCPDISIIIPAKDERETLQPLYERICTALEPLGKSFELIFVDDGSTDGSYEALREMHQRDPRVHALRFRVNYGKSPALAAGFAASKGRIIVTIDADLQDDPAEIPQLLKKLDEGFDLISGWKFNRRDPLSKRLFSKIFNAMVSRAGGISLHDVNCGLKCYRREVWENIQLYGEMHRFVPVLAQRQGFRITEVPVTHHPRRTGRSKFGRERLVRGLLDFTSVMFVTRLLQRPAHLLGGMGLLICTIGLGFGLPGIVLFCYGFWVSAGILTALWILLFTIGIQTCLLGLVAELLTYYHRREEPPYYIHERLD